MLLKLRNVTDSINFPISNRFFAAVLLVAAAVYSASLGLKAIARGSVPIFAFLVIALVVVFIGGFQKLDLDNMTFPESISEVLRFSAADFLSCGELVVLFVLLSYTKQEEKIKGSFLFTGGRLILIELLSFMGICVLERLCYTSEYPFFLLGSYSQPFSIQRADWIYAILYTILCLTSFSLQLMLSSKLLFAAFPKLKYREILSAVIMLVLSLLMNHFDINTDAVTGVGVILLAVIVPLILSAASLGKRLLMKNENNDDTQKGNEPQ